jgi:hypothetical protein
MVSLLVAGCGSTSVSQVSGPSDVRCATSVTANPQSVGADGGSVTVTVATTRDCAWNSSSDAAWIRLSTGTGQGESTFTASVDANPQIASRSGNVTVNGQRVSIAEAARPCTFDITPTSAAIEGGGGSGRVTVTTIAGCPWRPTSMASWIQVPAAASTGPGAFDFQVAENDGGERTGVISIADREVVIAQAAASPSNPGPGPSPTPLPAPTPSPVPTCTPTVTPQSIDTAAAASTQTIQLSFGPTCAWTAVSAASWLTIASATAGTGSATVSLAVAANIGGARTGTVSIAGQTITVRQTALSCTFALSPTSQTFAEGGASGRFTVTTAAACSWSVSKSVPWIDVAQGTGTGSGDVTFTVQANTTTTARSGSITVGGQTFSVSEAAAACIYTLNPTSSNMPVEGGHGRVGLTTASTCAWTAVASAPWLDVSNRSGTGSNDINFNVQPNSGTAARSATITVGGQVFTLNQAGVPCTFAINPASLNVGSAASTGQFTVTTQPGCTWTATSAAGWVAITAPTNGAGSGTGDVSYSVQANHDQTPRSATISVGGQTHTVNQAAAPAPCTYSLSPATTSAASAGGVGTFTVMTQSGCAWTATTMDAWITVNTGSGIGTANASYALQPNSTGMARSGTITVAGQTFGVSQAP